MDFKSTKQWKIWLAAIIIFFSGAIVGGVATTIVVQKVLKKVVSGKVKLSEGPFYKRLSRKLGLSEQQKKEIKLVLVNADDKLEDLRQEHRPKLIKIYRDTIEELKPKLNEKQLKQLNEFVEKQETRWKQE